MEKEDDLGRAQRAIDTLHTEINDLTTERNTLIIERNGLKNDLLIMTDRAELAEKRLEGCSELGAWIDEQVRTVIDEITSSQEKNINFDDEIGVNPLELKRVLDGMEFCSTLVESQKEAAVSLIFYTDGALRTLAEEFINAIKRLENR